MNKPIELKPCPFCGEVPVEGYRLGADWHECESGEVYISCSSPKHEGMCLLVYGKNFEQAANVWNRRAPLPDNKALTVECCGTCAQCKPGDGAPFCNKIHSAHYAEYVAETDGCMWYERRPPEKGE